MSQSMSFLKPVAFATCSYLKRKPGARAKMVFEALSSWADLLELPFAEKIFLDDRSPECGALKLLASTQLLEKFTRAEYCTSKHPAHCNFGYVGALQLAASKYIMHLDDDVYVSGPIEESKRLIDLAIEVMEEDPAIMGFNLLNLDPSFHGPEWLPGEPYRAELGLYHPQKFFGNAASIIRRDLLERLPYSQLMAWGENQPTGWENLVSNTPREFLVGSKQTPFHVKRTSYFFNSVNEISTRGRILYLARVKLKSALGLDKAPRKTK